MTMSPIIAKLIPTPAAGPLTAVIIGILRSLRRSRMQLVPLLEKTPGPELSAAPVAFGVSQVRTRAETPSGAGQDQAAGPLLRSSISPRAAVNSRSI